MLTHVVCVKFYITWLNEEVLLFKKKHKTNVKLIFRKNMQLLPIFREYVLNNLCDIESNPFELLL